MWHRLGVSSHRVGLAHSSAPYHLLRRVSFLVHTPGQWEPVYLAHLAWRSTFCAPAFNRTLTSSSCNPKATSVRGLEAPPSPDPLAVRASTAVTPLDHLSSIRHPRPAGSGCPPCFWHLEASLPFEPSGVCIFFFLFYPVFHVRSGMESLCVAGTGVPYPNVLPRDALVL